MRAREFIVKVTIDDENNVEFELPDEAEDCTDQDYMMFPQQQEIELLKASRGKSSRAIDQLTDDDEK